MTLEESRIDLCPACRKVLEEIHAALERARNLARAAMPGRYESPTLVPIGTLCMPCLRKVTAHLRRLENSPDA